METNTLTIENVATANAAVLMIGSLLYSDNFSVEDARAFLAKHRITEQSLAETDDALHEILKRIANGLQANA